MNVKELRDKAIDIIYPNDKKMRESLKGVKK